MTSEHINSPQSITVTMYDFLVFTSGWTHGEIYFTLPNHSISKCWQRWTSVPPWKCVEYLNVKSCSLLRYRILITTKQDKCQDVRMFTRSVCGSNSIALTWSSKATSLNSLLSLWLLEDQCQCGQRLYAKICKRQARRDAQNHLCVQGS